jgi:LacI family transcriptional regulator
MSTKSRRRGPTALDVARKAGVAPATAARVLGNYSTVSPALRERVLRAAEQIGYRPNRLARSMVTGLTQTIGVVIANIEDQFFARLVRGVADEARASGFQLILANSDEDVREEQSAVQLLTERQIDGLIVAPCAVDQFDHLAELQSYGMPFTLLDRRIDELEVDSVLIDGVRAAKEATDFLLGLGHRRIAIVTDVVDTTGSAAHRDAERRPPTLGARLTGYLNALEEAGVPHEDRFIRKADPTVAGAREQTLALLDSGTAPSAIFTTDNTMTLGALEAFNARRVRIPDDVSLFGFDDLEWTKATNPPLSVVSQPISELGATAARALLGRIGGDEGPPQTYVLATELVHRASTGPPKTAG